MPITSDVNRWSKTGDGVTVDFAYTNKIFASSDLKVFLDGVEQTSGFTVSNVGVVTGGNVTFTTPPATGVKVEIVREVPFDQQADFIEGGKFPSQVADDVNDKSVILDQQLLDKVRRAIRVPDSETISNFGILPVLATRLNKLIGLDGLGNVTVSTKTIAEVEAAVDAVTSGGSSTDAASVTYTPAGAGAVVRNVQDVLRQTVNVLDFIPVAEHAAIAARTSTYDAYANIVSADAHAASIGAELFFPSGTYRINSDFKHIDGDQALASWRGAGPEYTILEFNVSTHSPRLVTYAPTLLRPERADVGTPTSDQALLDAQTALGHVVTLSDPVSDASKFAVGDWVFVSCGIDIYDADDELWRFSIVTRVVEIDAGSGNIVLADPIEEELIDDGWAPGSAKNTASDWANSTGYTAGDYVYGDTTKLWQATTSGTSSGTGPSDDTGVSWDQLTVDMGALKGNRDGRPVIQIVPSPAVGITVSDLTINALQFSDGGLDFRSTYGCRAENVWIRGPHAVAFGCSQSANHTRFVDVLDQSEKELAHERSFGTFAARNTVLSRCAMFGSKTNADYPAYIESNASVHFDHCRFSQQQGNNTAGIFVTSGHVSAVGCSFFGVSQPITTNVGIGGIKPDRPDLSMLCDVRGWQGNFSDILPEAFRRLWQQADPGQGLQVFSPGNSFRIYNNFAGGYTQTDPLMFRPTRLVPYTISFTPATSQTGTVVALPTAPQDGILDITDIRAVLLGAKVRWVTPAANNVDVDIFMSNGATHRRALALVKSFNIISVDSTTPKAQKFLGNGDTERLIDNTVGVDERIRIQYDSGAAAGGTVHVTLFLLIDEGAGGDGAI